MGILAERTTFSKDIMGRYVLNTWQEAMDSVSPADRLDGRPFDVVVVGCGSFGAAVAQHLFFNDTKHSHRVLVLEAGPLALAEHLQNLPLPGFGLPGPTETDPGVLRNEVWGLPWRSNVKDGYTGLAYCVGGRSVYFGGWAPRLLEAETGPWPATVLGELRAPSGYFDQASEQIGVTETNDFMHGELHFAMRKQLFDAIQAGDIDDVIPLSELPLHLNVPGGLSSLEQDELKLEAPLAVQGRSPRAGFFPINKFSSVPLIMEAARLASIESLGDDVKKRLMILPDTRVVELITGIRDGQRHVIQLNVRLVREGDREVTLPLPDGGVVVIANSTIESTRLALESFLVIPNYDQIGRNMIAHLRSNLTIRVPREAITSLQAASDLQSSALFVKCRHDFGGGSVGHFHFQVTASGLKQLSADSEAQLFKKIPDIDTIDRFEATNETHVVITIRGIGEMQPQNPNSRVILRDGDLDEFGKRRAFVTLEPNARDVLLWDAMDDASNQVAAVFANGHPFKVLTPMGYVDTSPGDDLKAILPYTSGPFGSRRDGLGTTHHEAGTLWMGDASTPSVTDEDARIKGVGNAYVAGPALFPSVGSPNPMLTGIALARRLGDKLIPPPALYTAEPGYVALFDGVNTQNWRMSSIRTESGYPGDFLIVDGVLEAVPGDDIGLYWCTVPTPADFILRLDWRRWREDDNSGVFLRFPHPDSKEYRRTAYVGVNFGFEVQIDQAAAPDGDPRHKTAAIYNFQGPSDPGNLPVKPVGEWNTYEIRVEGQTYTVILNDQQVNQFTFVAGSDPAFPDRALPSTPEVPRYIGLQAHPGRSRVGFRNIRVQAIGAPATAEILAQRGASRVVATPVERPAKYRSKQAD